MSAGTFESICIWWILSAFFTFGLLQFVTAPYGRHFRHGWGFEISNKVGWVLMELPSFSIMFYFFLAFDQSLYSAVLFMIWLAHYFNRTFIFPFRIHTKGKKMPVAILGSAIIFNGINAGLNGYFLSFLASYSIDSFFEWNFFLGVCILILGIAINQKSDTILINLRGPSDQGYKIPQGFLFKYISCPNHLGEIIQWLGFALLAWNWAALAFFIWTLANLIPRAMKHHKWYKSHFENYPNNRRAFIPFLI